MPLWLKTMEKFDITIIGAGIVGLAIASEMPQRNNLVIEKLESFGKETSSRNSEVIHAGIYYPAGFYKTRLCVEGNELIYKICKDNNINHKQSGKIIVAVNEEEEKDLEKLYKQGIENGVPGLKIISKDEIKRMEPNINAILGIYSPTTGIVDTHSLMRYFELKAKNKGTTFAYGCELIGAEKINSEYKITIKDSDGELYDFITKILINSAGLDSDKVAGMLGIDDYKLHYCKGEYFKVGGGKHKYINRLVYPHPTETSLGIHTVIDLQGQFKLGPNAFYVDPVRKSRADLLKLDPYLLVRDLSHCYVTSGLSNGVEELNYDVNPEHAESMYESAKKYLPFIELEDLTPDMSGIRPKLQAEGDPAKDFIIQDEHERGLQGFINLIGIESPGLTCAPAIARYVLSLIGN